MRIIAISDTHEQHSKIMIPSGDVLVHAGDFTYTGKIPAVVGFADWIESQPHVHKIVISGNHELSFQSPFRDVVINILKERGIIYLEDSGVEIDNVSFWGSPWQPRFYDWAFNLDRKSPELAAKWNLIPEDTNFLITHCPPYGILDQTTDNGSQGCELLEKRLHYLSKLKAHVFGHLHHDGGKMIEKLGVKFANAAICTDAYKPTNKPIIIDI